MVTSRFHDDHGPDYFDGLLIAHADDEGGGDGKAIDRTAQRTAFAASSPIWARSGLLA
jgi:hypothetical protein